MSRISTFLLVAALTLPLASCDAADDGPVVFGGVTLEPIGGATLRPSGSTLVVSDLPANAEGGFSVPGQSVDVAIVPVSLPAGGRFGSRAETADGAEIASMFATGLGQDSLRFVFSYGAAAGVSAVEIRYLLGGLVVFKIGSLPVAVGKSSVVLAAESAGQGGGQTGSTHMIRSGGRWIVVSDNEGSGNRPAGGVGGCAVLTVLPPAVAGVPVPPNGPLCVDRIEVRPLTGTAPEAARVVVASQGLSTFTVRSLGVE